MHVEIARNRSILANPQESEEHKTAARVALESIAADPSDRRQPDASFVLREFGVTGDESSTDNRQAISTLTVQKSDSSKRPLDWIPTNYTQDLPEFLASYKSIVNSPNSSPSEKSAAWRVVNDPEGELNRLVDGLLSELLEQANQSHLAAIDYATIHEFCAAKGWTKIPTRLLYFDRWLPAHFATDQGSQKLSELERYWLTADARARGEEPDDATIKILVEARRRIRTDPQFHKMILDGLRKGEITSDYVATLTADIWQTPEVTA